MNLVLGTMTFGPRVDEASAQAMLQVFTQSGYRELDSAFVYNEGDTERMLASLLQHWKGSPLKIATKVHPRITGRLDASAIDQQLTTSLERMGQQSIDLLYFHFPDRDTPLDSAVQKCAQLHHDGVFKELGVSNFPAWLVVELCQLCDKYDCPRPTVYQGMYNAITRDVERELFMVLRRYGIRFYAFNPLAGGLLTGKHVSIEQLPSEGRFARLQSYRNRYWKKSYFEAIELINLTCQKLDINPTEAALRWLAYHSEMDAASGDAIILGASKIEHLEQNIQALSGGALPQELLDAYDSAWMGTQSTSPSYFNFFSS